MLNLSSHTLFLEKDGHGYVYNWNTKKLLVTNLSVISILKLCNGKRTLDEVIRFFAMSIQRDVYKVVQELIAVDILIDGSVFARTSKYEEITSFFLSLTHQCNLNCHFCLKHNLTKYKELEHKEWVKIINIISEFNDKNKTIYLTGGEPLMMAQFEKIYTYIYQKNMQIVVYSNGTLFTKRILQLFKECPPKAILLSIDGSNKEIHDKQRGVKGSFDKVILSSRELVKLNKTQVYWQVVVDKENLADMDNIAQLACEMGVKNIHYGLMSTIGKGVNNSTELSCQEMVQFYEKCYEIGSKFKGIININLPIQMEGNKSKISNYCSCGIGNMIHINERGFISPCYGWDLDRYQDKLINSIEDLKKNNFPEFFYREITDYEACSTCGVRNICRGGCKVEIYNLTGNFHGCNVKKKNALEEFVFSRIRKGYYEM